jgi:Na+-transporting methylmalonyl-CoA/oxaloacetate decarboxylase gamma subunit
MIADSYAGALTLSVVNMAVVCLVLGLACLAISATRKVVAVFRFDPSANPPLSSGAGEAARSTQASVSQACGYGEAIVADGQAVPGMKDVKARAAIAAVMANLASEANRARSVFVRNVPDSGAWGKSAGPRGALPSEAYRSASLACHDSPGYSGQPIRHPS